MGSIVIIRMGISIILWKVFSWSILVGIEENFYLFVPNFINRNFGVQLLSWYISSLLKTIFSNGFNIPGCNQESGEFRNLTSLLILVVEKIDASLASVLPPFPNFIGPHVLVNSDTFSASFSFPTLYLFGASPIGLWSRFNKYVTDSRKFWLLAVPPNGISIFFSCSLWKFSM